MTGSNNCTHNVFAARLLDNKVGGGLSLTRADQHSGGALYQWGMRLDVDCGKRSRWLNVFHMPSRLQCTCRRLLSRSILVLVLWQHHHELVDFCE